MGDPKKCKKCQKTINSRSKDDKLTCVVCKDQVHLSCSEIDKELFKVITESIYVKYTCHSCANDDESDKIKQYMRIVHETMKPIFDDFTNQIKKLQSEIEKMKSKFNDTSMNVTPNLNTPKSFTKLFMSQNNSSNKKRKWSDIVNQESSDNDINQKSKMHKLSNDQPESILIMQPSEDLGIDEITDEVKKDMRKIVSSKLDPVNDPVLAMRFSSKGKLIIKCDNKESVDLIKNKLQSLVGEAFNLSEPKPMKPYLRINDINAIDYVSDDELIKYIVAQNKDIFKSSADIKLIKSNKHSAKRKNNTIHEWYSAIICVDKRTCDNILYKKSLRIGWSSCRVSLYVNIKRCFKCNGYNHTANNCNKADHVCPKCSGNHKISECTSTEIKCCNCLNMNAKSGLNMPFHHFAWSEKCPVFQRKSLSVSNKTNYGD